MWYDESFPKKKIKHEVSARGELGTFFGGQILNQTRSRVSAKPIFVESSSDDDDDDRARSKIIRP